VVGEASTSSSIGRASHEDPSPPDPSLIVIGSASTPDRGGLGGSLLPLGVRYLDTFWR